MEIEYLVKMANEIGAFFDAEAGAGAPKEVARHLHRFWDPRMRRQILEHLATDGGHGLHDSALAAVRLLAEEQKAK